MRSLILIASAATLVAGAAFAEPAFQAQGTPEPTTNSSSTADQTGNTDPNKVICKNVKPPTGTRIGSSRNRQRICQTKSDWEQQEAEAQAAARTARGGASAGGNENSRQPGQ